MLVSIILPIYNMEKYLERCMESILAQTYPNLQIIMVDDGSKDRTPLMCDAYSQRDSRIMVIHKENGGLSSARNAGMEVAKGDYLFFVDPDDKIPVDAVEKMVAVAEQYPYDVIKGLYYVVKGNNSRLTKCMWDEGTVSRVGTAQERERWRLMKTSWSFGCVWAGMYRFRFIQEHQLVFDNNDEILLEDVLFNSKLMAYEPTYYALCEPVYEYYYVEGSLLNRYIPDLSKKLRSLLREYTAFLNQNGVYEKNLDLVVTLTARYFCWTASEKVKEKGNTYAGTKEEIKTFGTDDVVHAVLQNPNVMKQLCHLSRKMDSCFYCVCLCLLKHKCYALLTMIYMLANPFMKIYSGRRARV